tara:strand:- start:277 stop:627 length:351 start_codon:yes stop_codon:yes gene_type:complete
MNAISLTEKLALVDTFWDPRIITQYNGNDVMVVKVKGEFVWHSHPDTDDFFFVVKGRIRIELEHETVQLEAGQLFVVPRGVEHRPVADEEAHLLLIEPAGTPNTGSPETASAKPYI